MMRALRPLRGAKKSCFSLQARLPLLISAGGGGPVTLHSRNVGSWAELSELINPAAVVAVLSSATFIGGLGLFNGFCKLKMDNDKLKMDKDKLKAKSFGGKVKLVKAKLSIPFDAKKVLPVKFGEVFPRKKWQSEFSRLLKGEMYVLYRGPSELGKSVAVTHHPDLQGRQGVIYLSLEEATSDSVLTLLTNALGFQTDFQEGKMPSLHDVLFVFKQACVDFKKETGVKPVIIVEDLHHCEDLSQPGKLNDNARMFVATLVRIHNAGIINVVYTISDDKGEKMLRSVSGHSKRLTALAFPRLPDEELATSLWSYALGVDAEKAATIAEDSLEKYYSFGVVDAQGERVLPPQCTGFVLDRREDVDFIVSKLGSHMGDVTKCLREVVERGCPVKDAVDAVIEQSKGSVLDMLLGEAAVVGDVDRSTFIPTAHTLFEALSVEGVEVVRWRDVVMDNHPSLESREVMKAVRQLVDKNLVSYVNPLEVSLHARRLKWAYLGVRQDRSVVEEFEEAHPQA